MLQNSFCCTKGHLVIIYLSTRADKGAAQTELTLVAVRRIRRPQATIDIIFLQLSQHSEPYLKD
jgi:hypothetical protein